MSENSFKSIHRVLQNECQNLQVITTKIKKIYEIQQHLLPLLEPELRKYCEVANIIDQCLVLLAANGSIATMLRFQTPTLLAKFNRHPALNHIKTLRIKVRPLPTNRTPSQRKKSTKMPPLSIEVAQQIATLAESLEDPKLKEVLKKIASHTEDSDKT